MNVQVPLAEEPLVALDALQVLDSGMALQVDLELVLPSGEEGAVGHLTDVEHPQAQDCGL